MKSHIRSGKGKESIIRNVLHSDHRKKILNIKNTYNFFVVLRVS